MRVSKTLITISFLASSFGRPLSAQLTQRISVDSSEAQATGESRSASISTDGRYAVFQSDATNLVPGDTNAKHDIFLRDRITGTTTRISVSSGGAEANDESRFAVISADGRYVAFHSLATNLVAGDTNANRDVFVRDLQLGTTERVSVTTGGVQGNSGSQMPAISADGRFVAFYSGASNLVAGDDGFTDVFVRDRQSGTTERVSDAPGGANGNGLCALERPAITDDGRYVSFASFSSNLVSGDTNARTDIFVRDRQSGATERANVHSAGTQANFDSSDSAISDDGRYVAFWSTATNLVAGDSNGDWDVFVRDRQAGTTERVSVSSSGAQGNERSYYPSISSDGRYVAFGSVAGNLTTGDTNSTDDAFVRDRQSGTTTRVSLSSTGSPGSAGSYRPEISSGGRYVVFYSIATNLVSGDTNALEDVYLHDREAAGFASLCFPGLDGVIACPCSNPPSAPDRGCNNSSSTGGARMTASGAAYLSSDTLGFVTTGAKPSSLCMLIQGTAPFATGAIYGHGVRCVGGLKLRLYANNSTAGGSIAFGPPTFTPVATSSAALGDVILAGQSRWYAVHYRDPFTPCPTGLSAMLVSPFNASQTGRVTWWL